VSNQSFEETAMSGTLDLLRSYLRSGWRVLAVHPVRDGICACYKGRACDHPGKHPIFKGGCHSATTDEAILRVWFEANPDSNWGIATGTQSGLLVLDIDPRHGGDESLAELVRVHGDLPTTPTVKTGGGGRQFYFRFPVGSGLTIGSGVRPGIDFRGDGGMVVAPPSLHQSGQRYEWIVPPDTPLVDARPWLVELLLSGRASASSISTPLPRSGKEGHLILTVRGGPPDLTGDGAPDGVRHHTLCRLVGIHLDRGDSRATLEALVRTWAERCIPPMDETEAEAVLDDLWNKQHGQSHEGADEVGSGDLAPVLDTAAYHGLFGELVKAVSPHTEADDPAVLLCLLAAFGSACGWSPHFDHGRIHGGNLFVALVGATASRKGTATGIAKWVLEKADPEWAKRCLRPEGFGTGEGLIHAVRDDRTLADGTLEPGVADKRLLVVEEEMAKMFSLGTKDASILTPTIRSLFDRSAIGKLNRDAYRCENPHGSIIANITPADLRQALTGRGAVGLANGLINRFLLCHTGRQKFHPRGGRWRQAAGPFVSRVTEALAKAKGVGLLDLDTEAGAKWDELYHTLEDHPDTVFGAATSRASDQVMKLALLFALADGSASICPPHLSAAVACWRYCEATARLLFGDADHTTTGTKPGAAERLALRLVKPILTKPGINRRELYKEVGGKPAKEEMSSALRLLHASGLAQQKKVETDGRPGECWFPATDTAMATNTPSAPDEPLIPRVAEVEVEELPVPNVMCLEPPMTVTELSDTVRERGGKLVWVDGSVHVVGLGEVSDRMRAAVGEHQHMLQDMLRTLVPAPQQESPVPTDEEFKRHLLSLVEDKPLDLSIFTKQDPGKDGQGGAGDLAAK
jgi:hypothetical protein